MIKADKLALFNEQLAGMLKAGIPLEGALRKTAKDIGNKKFAEEIKLLEDDLAKGTPFEKALEQRRFPDFYKKMLITGSKSDRLPEALTAVADYYRRRSEIFIRLSGLMLYPGLVMIATICLSFFTAFFFGSEILNVITDMNDGWGGWGGRRLPDTFWVSQFFSLIVLTFLFLFYLFTLTCRPLRYYFSWKFSPFRDVNIANFAHMMVICLKSGMSLTDSLGFANMFERGKIKAQLDMLTQNIKEGMSLDGSLRMCKFLPATAQWLIITAEDKPEEGFHAVADLFNRRAQYKADILLYVSLPLSICFIAGVILIQLSGLVSAIRQFISILGGY